mmetsp:Transcript_8138/g.26695  ORF Transcript_8138/g.26695 Transcript_8138/m.26695 type:complete len:650 (-) Transcript_8138:217-2166(-)
MAPLALVLLLGGANAVYYLPGVAPVSYRPGSTVQLSVNKLTSTHTQIPYDYYSLPFCHPKIKEQAENIGERLAGDRIENSLYKLHVSEDEQCKIVCKKRVGKSGARAFAQSIDDDYRVHWIVDNLPASTLLTNKLDSAQPYHVRGFPVGFKMANAPPGDYSEVDPAVEFEPWSYYIFNHVRIIIAVHRHQGLEASEAVRIVGFRVEPFSVDHQIDASSVGETFDPKTAKLHTCSAAQPVTNSPSKYQRIDKPTEVVFTYDVLWEDSATPWANRWDVYLQGNPDDKIHWFSITNSTMIVVFLTVMVAMILFRTLSKDIAQYNEALIDESNEESGWKLVHADVFRPPRTSPMLFAVAIGSGAQIGAMLLCTLTFAMAGFLSPANRGSLITALLMLFVFMGAFAGYCSSRVYKAFRGTEWMKNTVLTAVLFPGFVFATFLGLDIALTCVGSSGAVPFSTLLMLVVLWFGVSVPLVFAGAYVGFKREIEPYPVRTNQIPRLVPPQPWYMHPVLTTTFGGILPFGAVSVELFFIMSAIWLHQVYYIFGFLFLVMMILVATCAEITILLCYFQLCNEDYHWWWRSFLTSGSTALYVFLYSAFYFSKLETNFALTYFLYFGYMSIISLGLFLVTGTVGFFSALWFNLVIFSSIKVD